MYMRMYEENNIKINVTADKPIKCDFSSGLFVEAESEVQRNERNRREYERERSNRKTEKYAIIYAD